MARHYQAVTAIALMLLVPVAAARPAYGQIPTTADVTACNDEAPRAVKAGTASPIPGDHARAAGARAAGRTVSSTDVPGKALESSDPQLHGMQSEGARDATYQAAYRSCMRRRGF
jgi:hypothetical protein